MGCGVQEESERPERKRVIWKELIKLGEIKKGRLLHYLCCMCQACKRCPIYASIDYVTPSERLSLS